MTEPPFSLGIGPDGRPYAVHATAAPEYGAGALEGLVIGLCLGDGGALREDTPPLVGMLAALVESLMARGMLRADDLAERYRPWPAPPSSEAPLRALPIALFYAGQPDELLEAVLAEAALSGADVRSRVASAAVAAAISAGTFDMVQANDMAVAAVRGLEAAAVRIGDDAKAPAETLKDDLRKAVTAAEPDALGDADPLSDALRRAFWYLLHTDDFAAALEATAARGKPLAMALTGAILGACLGAEAIPAAWRAAVAPRAAPLVRLLHSEDE